MYLDTEHFEVRLAESDAEIEAAQRLRYAVFVEELGAAGPLVDHDARLERDRFDPHVDHLLLFDLRRPAANRVVGAYRLMRAAQAAAGDGFYAQSEFDLSPILVSRRRVLELGRSCLHADYRGGAGLLHLWSGLAGYVARHRIEILFGVASFQGTDPQSIAAPLSLLHHRHRAPASLCPRALEPGRQRMDLLEPGSYDPSAAMRAVPALIKAYLRLGGLVGPEAWLDRPFNCIDVCLVLDTAAMPDKQRALYDSRAKAQPHAAIATHTANHTDVSR